MADRTTAEVFPPGEYLRDELEARGWSQVAFAEIIGRPVRVVNEIIAGKRAISPETARELGAALETGPEVWLNLEAVHQLRELERTKPAPTEIAHKARLSSFYPVREMIRRKWIEESKEPDVLESRLLRFFEIKSLDEEPRLACAAKRSGDQKQLTPAQTAWLYRVKHLAGGMRVGRFSSSILRNALARLEAFREAPEEIRHIPRLLAESGVRLVIVEPLPASKIDGVCLWLDASSPVIGLSLRFDRIDNFWFVLRHEIEHVLNGDGKRVAMVDSELQSPNAPADEDLPPEERKANAAASDFCVSRAALNDFVARVGPLYSRTRVLNFARVHKVHPGLVAGQLQHRIKRYDLFRATLVPIRHFITPTAITDGFGHFRAVST